MTKPRDIADSANDNSIEGSRLVDGSVPLSKLEGGGGGGDASNVTYTASFTGAVARTVEGALDDWVSVVDFGADPTGVAGSSTAINAAIQASPKVFFPTGTYLVDANIAINTANTTIDFCGSTLVRGTTGRLIDITGGGYARLYNGIVDGLNSGANRAQLVEINAGAKDVVLRDMTFLNNCAGYPTPIASQDTDHINMIRAKRFVADNCVFRVASRQGISITSWCYDLMIRNCTFEDCYLFGIDLEPNSSSTFMYDSVIIDGNNFINCGPKSETNRVWNSGGPIAIASSATSTSIARNIVFSNNRIISTDFFSASPTVVEPYIRITQYETLSFTGNTVINLDRVLFGDFGTVHKRTTVTGNNFYALSGGMSGLVFPYGSGGVVCISGNNFTSVITGPATSLTISGNYFTGGLSFNASVGPVTVNGNTFFTSGTCINTSAKSSEMVIVGNNSNNDTIFIGPVALTDSVVASNRYAGTIA